MAPFATPADVSELWRPLSLQEAAVAAARLLMVSALIRQLVPTVETRISSGSLDPDVVKLIAVDAVRRAMENPSEGVRSRTQTVGPFSESVTYTDAGQAGVWLSDAEVALLRGSAGATAARAGVRSIRVQTPRAC
jgi:hypothetical protein